MHGAALTPLISPDAAGQLDRRYLLPMLNGEVVRRLREQDSRRVVAIVVDRHVLHVNWLDGAVARLVGAHVEPLLPESVNLQGCPLPPAIALHRERSLALPLPFRGVRQHLVDVDLRVLRWHAVIVAY